MNYSAKFRKAAAFLLTGTVCLSSAAQMTLPVSVFAEETQQGEDEVMGSAERMSDEQKEQILSQLAADNPSALNPSMSMEKSGTDEKDSKIDNSRESEAQLNGIDISHWQSDIDLNAVEADFVLCKATGGTRYRDPDFKRFADTVLAKGKLLGFYHFAHDGLSRASAKSEAAHFYEQVKDYIGLGIPVLDYEAPDLLASGAGWAYDFVDTFYQLSGVRCMIYTSGWWVRTLDWSDCAKEGYPLWVAQYGLNEIQKGYAEKPTLNGQGTGDFDIYWMHQYGSQGRLPGYGANLDLNKFYGSAEDWKKLAAPERSQAQLYRLYSELSGEHFYTSSEHERDGLTAYGWIPEGEAWKAPTSGDIVYRLYNPNAGDHHYTLNTYEREHLISVGWQDEGIGWLSDPQKQVPVYRCYNPNAITGAHHFTTDHHEIEELVKEGWVDEGISWYGRK